jgi:cysteine desulfurase/selenocysteine lyase
MIYFNNAATSFPKPAGVLKAVCENLESLPNEGRGSSNLSGDPLQLVRNNISSLCNIDSEAVLLCPSATYALNFLTQGLLSCDGKVHCLTTSMEHNSVLRPLHILSMKNKVNVTFFRLSENDGKFDFNLEDFENNLKPETKLVIVSHASNVTGLILPIEEISMLTGRYNIPLLIDASQSMGNLKIDLSKLAGEIYIAFAGHKNLFGPTGTGGFIIKGHLFQPIIVGGTGVKSDLIEQPQILPHYYESGSPNLPGISGLAAGVEFVLAKGIDKIGMHKQSLTELFINELKDIDRIIFYLPSDEDFRCGVVSFNIDGFTAEQVGFFLNESYEIICRTGLHCSPLIHKNINSQPDGTVRFSFSVFNTKEEIYFATEALKQICRL